MRGMTNPQHTRRCRALQRAIEASGIFTDATPSAILLDLDLLRDNVTALQAAGYPEGTLHTFAVKANPVGGVLQEIKALGMGAEVASPGELHQALHVGFPSHTIVFDSPAKTREELELAMRAGVRLNLDNLQELDRLAQLLQQQPQLLPPQGDPAVAQPLIGIRVNPQVGLGSIAMSSTAGAISKFGVPLGEARQQLLEAFRAYPWLNALHLHVGSQGCPLELAVDGAVRVWELLEEIQEQCGPGRIRCLDIGGGLPVEYMGEGADEGDVAATFKAHVELLRARLPQLFTSRVQLVTEFGRVLLAKAGFAASKVEYTKVCGGRPIIVNHIGADLLPRTAYMPQVWPMRVMVCDSQGNDKALLPGAHLQPTDVVGPLCFQGDKLAEARPLPAAEPGDYIMVPDCGAYTLSMFSKYNSRCSPAMVGFSSGQRQGGDLSFCVLRRADRIEDVLAFWNQV